MWRLFRKFLMGQSGMTGIELLVSSALVGLVVVAGMSLLNYGTQSFNVGIQQISLQLNLRSVAQTVADELRIGEEFEILEEIGELDPDWNYIYLDGDNIIIQRVGQEPLVLGLDSETAKIIALEFFRMEGDLIRFLIEGSDETIETTVRPPNLKELGGLSQGTAIRYRPVPAFLRQFAPTDFAIFAEDHFQIKPQGNGSLQMNLQGHLISNTNEVEGIELAKRTPLFDPEVAIYVGPGENTPEDVVALEPDGVPLRKLSDRVIRQQLLRRLFDQDAQLPANDADLVFRSSDQEISVDSSFGRIDIGNKGILIINTGGDGQDLFVRASELMVDNGGTIRIEGNGRAIFLIDGDAEIRGIVNESQKPLLISSKLFYLNGNRKSTFYGTVACNVFDARGTGNAVFVPFER